MKTILLILSWIIVGWIAYRTGKNSGYNLGYDHGYHQCARDYDIKDVSPLDYFQPRDFEVETGIAQARELEKKLKGEYKEEDE